MYDITDQHAMHLKQDFLFQYHIGLLFSQWFLKLYTKQKISDSTLLKNFVPIASTLTTLLNSVSRGISCDSILALSLTFVAFCLLGKSYYAVLLSE